MSRWPSSIPKEHRRSWVSVNTINKWFKVDGLQAVSYIARAERLGSPIRHNIHNGSKCYRALDVIARARAECLKIEPVGEVFEKLAISELVQTRKALEKKVKTLKSAVTHTFDSRVISESLTGKAMVHASEIVAQSVPYENQCGVYFLVKSDRVVYVGQSIKIGARITEHSKTKDFDAYAYISCSKDKLDVLESLYIHTLNPEYQGRSGYKKSIIAAPYSFAQLVSMSKSESIATKPWEQEE